LRNERVQVGVALSVAVGAEVDRQVVDGHGDVGAVVGVEAADQPLCRLAAALVLGDDQAGDVVQDLLRGAVWAQLVVVRPDLVGGGGRHRLPGLDDHLRKPRGDLLVALRLRGLCLLARLGRIRCLARLGLVLSPDTRGRAHGRRGEDEDEHPRRHDVPPV